MALIRATLKAEIISIANSLKAATDQDAAIEEHAERLSLAFDTYIRSATITVNTNIVGTDATGSVVTGTGTGTGTIS